MPEALHSAILSGLDLLPNALLVVDEHGTILHANEAAKQALNRGRNVTAVDNALHIASTDHDARLHAIFANAGDIRAPSGLVVPRVNRRPFAVVVVPVPNHEDVDGRPTSLVFLGDPEITPQPDTVLLTRMYGFTHTESKVAALLMQGKTVEDLAGALRITQHTARNHLKRLFAKTNTKKQPELVHMLLSSPAFLRLPNES